MDLQDIVLSVRNLSVYRSGVATVENVSFSLKAGTDTALVGPNGAGKTTLVGAILGIVPKKTGEIVFMGQSLDRGGIRARQDIAYLPQNCLFDRRIPMTVEELVGLGWDKLSPSLPWLNYRQRRGAVREALARVNAFHLRHQSISNLSGGETKRILLAYCLVLPRKLLILDEAPAGLDVKGELEFYQMLYQLKEERGWTILQISHDFDMVSRYCDYVLCLNRSLLCQGKPEVVLSPANLSLAYGAEFVPYKHNHR